MLTKIYLIMLAVFVAVSAFLSYYSWIWLQSIDKPQTVVDNYNLWSGYGSVFLWLSSLILLILANVILWSLRNSWALWTTLAYFSVFVVIDYFLLGNVLADYKQNHNFAQANLPIGAFFGIGLCVAAAIFVFFNQFAVLRLHEKMFPPKELTTQNIDDENLIETASEPNN